MGRAKRNPSGLNIIRLLMGFASLYPSYSKAFFMLNFMAVDQSGSKITLAAMTTKEAWAHSALTRVHERASKVKGEMKIFESQKLRREIMPNIKESVGEVNAKQLKETKKTFSDYAYEKLTDLYNNHSHEVGRHLKETEPVKYKSYDSTDCITYSLNVISYAFKKVGNEAAAKHVWGLGKHGTELAKYLVSHHNWKGIYINPDAKHPADGNSEHVYTSYLASKTCKYYQIPLTYKVENYTVTPKNHPAYQKLNKKAGVSLLNTIDIASLELVKFGFGVSKGGMHTWVFSEGKVYEVHWDKIGSELYEASSLRTFPWLSGVIVVPLDQATFLSVSAQLKCRT